MKKIIILLTLFIFPVLAFTQTPSYDLQTAKKFYKAKDILKNAKANFVHTGWWYTGTAANGDAKFFSKEKYFNTEQIAKQFKSQKLYSFLQDENNRIALSALADYITNTEKDNIHNLYETLLAIGIDPIEAAIRVNRPIIEGNIRYAHCYVEVTLTPSGGFTTPISTVETIEVNITEQEIEEIRTQLENEKPLVDQFNKDMNKFKRQIRKEKVEKTIENFGNKLGAIIKPMSSSFNGMGKNYAHW